MIVVILFFVSNAIYTYFMEKQYPHSVGLPISISASHRDYDVRLFFSAPVFGVQQLIDVSVSVTPSPEYIARQGSAIAAVQDMPKKLYIIFFDATFEPPESVNSEPLGAFVEMTKSNNLTVPYRNSTTIVYSEEGKKIIFLSENQLPQQLNVNTTYLEKQAIAIQISSLDSLYAYRNGKINLTLTYVAVAFTVLLAREFGIGVADNISKLLNRGRSSVAHPTGKEQPSSNADKQ